MSGGCAEVHGLAQIPKMDFYQIGENLCNLWIRRFTALLAGT